MSGALGAFSDRSLASLEAPEVAGYRNLWAAAPEAVVARYRLAQREVGGVHCTVAAAMPGLRLLNHALGLDGDDWRQAAALAAIESFFAEHGTPALIAVREGARIEQALVARGYERDYAWVKFWRDTTSVTTVRCDLAVRLVDVEEAQQMGEIIASGFELPAEMAAWFAALVGRRGWHCLGAYDGSQLVACGALYAVGDAGWLTWAATDPPYRGRRAQKALLCARIALAHRLGLTTLVTETGDQEPGRPDASYRNILAAGFRPVFTRHFWRPR